MPQKNLLDERVNIMQLERSGFQAAGLHAQRGYLELARSRETPDKNQEDQDSKDDRVHVKRNQYRDPEQRSKTGQ